MKKAQITIFMILGILLLAGSAFFILAANKGSPAQKISGDNPVENFIDGCIKDTAGYGLYLLGIHGGKIYDLEGAFEKNNLKVKYAIPSLEESKKDLEKHIDENLNAGVNSCLKNLKVFSEQYDKIETGNVSSQVIFADGATIVRVNMSVILSKGNAVKKYYSFDNSFSVRYKKILYFIEGNLVSGNIPNANVFSNDIEALLVKDAGENTDIYAVMDKMSNLNNKKYVFLTALPLLSRNDVCPAN